MTPVTRGSLAVIAALGLAGCALEPDVGKPLASACSNADTDDTMAISFRSQIRPLIARSVGGCSCHLPSSSGPGTGILLGGLDLSSLSSLRAGGFTGRAANVVAAQPCASIMYQKVYDAPPFGSRMPLGGPYWSDDEVALLHDWIAEGAPDN